MEAQIMEIYKDMYYKLAAATAEAIETLREAQKETEEMFVSGGAERQPDGEEERSEETAHTRRFSLLGKQW